jgi:predicted exporter
LRLATQGLPVSPDAFTPFVQQVERAKESGTFTRDSLQGTSVAMALDAMLWQQGTQWQALLPLQLPRAEPGARPGENGLPRIRGALAEVAPGQLRVVNLRAQSDALYDGYLSAALRLSSYGLAAIVLLLALALRSAVRVARVLGPLLLAVLLVTSGFALAGVPLTILHLIGMLLIVAVGSNYALFFDRSAADPDPSGQSRMLASLLVANVSTVMGFAVLAGSSVPVLSALGRTVAPGTLLALWLAALLAPRESFSSHEH